MDKVSPIPVAATNAERWTPYRHPQPKESPPELVIPNVIPEDDRVWVPVDDNVWFRPLCLSATRGYWMNLLKVRFHGQWQSEGRIHVEDRCTRRAGRPAHQPARRRPAGGGYGPA